MAFRSFLRWGDHSEQEFASSEVTFDTCEAKSIQMEYYDKTGLAIAQLRWSSTLVPKEIIPQQNLRPGEVLPTPTGTATATSTATSTPTNTATATPEICSPNGTGISGSYYTYSAATNDVLRPGVDQHGQAQQF